MTNPVPVPDADGDLKLIRVHKDDLKDVEAYAENLRKFKENICLK